MSASRNANGHRRRKVRAQVLAEEDTCWLCEKPVNKDLATPDPGSPEVDEIVPVSLGGSPYDRSNCRLAHRICNIIRGNDPDPHRAKAQPLHTSRTW